MPETSPLLLPLRVNKPIGRYIRLPISETVISAQYHLFCRGLFYVVDILLNPEYLPTRIKLEFVGYMQTLDLDYGDLPSHPHLIERLDLSSITPELASAIRSRLHKLTGNVAEGIDPRDLGRPSFLALALVPDWPSDVMNSELYDEFEKLLAMRGLKPCMKFGQIFEYKFTEVEKMASTSLSDEQMELLTKDIHRPKTLSAEAVAWIDERSHAWRNAINVLVTLLAVRAEERPEELVKWFTSRGIPLEPLSADDLKRAMKEARY